MTIKTRQAHHPESRRPVILPEGAGVIWFGSAGLVNAAGTGFFYPFSLLFFHTLTKLSYAIIGLGLTLTTLAVLPAMVWIGRLVDRAGPRRVLIAAGLVRAAAFVGYVTERNLVAFLILSTLLAAGNRAEHAATPVLATAMAPEGKTSAWLALSRTVLNAGIGAGALIAGIVLVNSTNGFAILGLVNAASFLLASILYLPLREQHRTGQQAARSRARPWRHRLFIQFALASAVMWLVAIAVETGAPVYIVTHLRLPAWTVGVLFAVNTALLTCLQLPVASRLEGRRPLVLTAVGAILSGGLLAALGMATGRGLALQLSLLVSGMVLYTLGELITSQARLVILTSIPLPAERGAYLAFNQIFVGIATALTPALVTTFLDHSPPALWWTLLACVALVAAEASSLQRRRLIPRPTDFTTGSSS